MAELKTIESKMYDVLSGDALKNALDFAAFMRANNFTLDPGNDGEGWAVGGNVGDSIGFILINGAPQVPGPWTIWFNSCDFGDSGPVDDDLKETAWAHASICGHFSSDGKDCGCGDQPGFHRTILGKEFENRCHSPLMFTSPEAKTLENVKKLMLMLKQNSAGK